MKRLPLLRSPGRELLGSSVNLPDANTRPTGGADLNRSRFPNFVGEIAQQAGGNGDAGQVRIATIAEP